jgi:hypothetical protein
VNGRGPETRLLAPAALICCAGPARPDTEGETLPPTVCSASANGHLADDGSTIAIVKAAQPGTNEISYSDHEQLLLPAAQTAGLRHLHDIVPTSATTGETPSRTRPPSAPPSTPALAQRDTTPSRP